MRFSILSFSMHTRHCSVVPWCVFSSFYVASRCIENETLPVVWTYQKYKNYTLCVLNFSKHSNFLETTNYSQNEKHTKISKFWTILHENNMNFQTSCWATWKSLNKLQHENFWIFKKNIRISNARHFNSTCSILKSLSVLKTTESEVSSHEIFTRLMQHVDLLHESWK